MRRCNNDGNDDADNDNDEAHQEWNGDGLMALSCE